MILTRESAHEMLTSGECTQCGLEFDEQDRAGYISADLEVKLCAHCTGVRESALAAHDIGASTRELDIRARERRSFPSRQQMVQRIKEHVSPHSWPQVDVLLLGILVDAEPVADELVRAECQRCHYVFVVAEIAACPICGERNVRPA